MLADILLLLTAGIWGFGFVAQRSGMEYIGPFAFNGIRFILGSLSLLPFIFFRRMAIPAGLRHNQRLLPASLSAGCCLFVAVIFQQFGVLFTTAGNAGFITGLYVVFTPIFGIFLGKKTGPATWLGAVFTITGLYFLSVAGSSNSINPGDILIVISAVFWTLHVLLIDYFAHAKDGARINALAGVSRRETPKLKKCHGRHFFSIDPLELSAGQFAVCGVLALAGAFLAEPYVGAAIESIDPELLKAGLFAWLPFPELIKSGAPFPAQALIPILYGGLGSVGIAYTFQVIAQRDAPPAHTTIILCFEGGFAALGGVLLLSEKIGPWTLLGFTLMLAGMLTTQLEVIAKSREK